MMNFQTLITNTHQIKTQCFLVVLLILLSGCGLFVEETNTYREVEGNHTDRWVWGGADRSKLESAFSRMKNSQKERAVAGQWDTVIEFGPGNWVFELITLGDEEYAKAERAAQAGNIKEARHSYLAASNYYQIAKFPYVRDHNYPHYLIAYKKSMQAYEAAGKYFEVPLEVVEIPFDSGIVRGYIHLAEAALSTAAPLVIASGGVDVFKVEYYPMIKKFNQRGVSVLVADLPGVGESNFVAATPDHDHVYSKFFDVLTNDLRVNTKKIGLFATSWGGNASAKAAFRDMRFIGAVSACAPVHEALAPPQWLIVKGIPPFRFDVLADRLGIKLPVEQSEYLELSKRSRSFSLIEQGIVGNGKRPSVPLLVINTNDDPLAPKEEMTALAEASENSDLVLTGPGGHCGSRDSLLSESIPWLIARMNNVPMN